MRGRASFCKRVSAPIHVSNEQGPQSLWAPASRQRSESLRPAQNPNMPFHGLPPFPVSTEFRVAANWGGANLRGGWSRGVRRRKIRRSSRGCGDDEQAGNTRHGGKAIEEITEYLQHNFSMVHDRVGELARTVNFAEGTSFERTGIAMFSVPSVKMPGRIPVFIPFNI